MSRSTDLFDLLARLLSYPGPDYPHAARACQQLLRDALPQQGEPLGRFLRWIESTSLEEWEEQFTRTFDLNPICCLEAGWQLYGEDYTRGTFLVQMRGLLREHGVPESLELPDHLSNLLPLLGRMTPQKAGPLCASHLLPALEKMQAGLAGTANPYEDVLLVVGELLKPLAAPYPRPAPRLVQLQPKTEEVLHG